MKELVNSSGDELSPTDRKAKLPDAEESDEPSYIEFNDAERARNRPAHTELLNLTYTFELSITEEDEPGAPNNISIYFNGTHLVGAPETISLSAHLQASLVKHLCEAAHRCFYEALLVGDIQKGKPTGRVAIKRYEEYRSEELKETKDLLGAPRRGGKESSYDFSRLLEYYDRYHPTWKKASKLFNASQLREVSLGGRIASIKAAFPDLPLDLIKRLDDLDKYLHSPSYIAIEHAARLCGLPADRDETSYSPQYLLACLCRYEYWILSV